MKKLFIAVLMILILSVSSICEASTIKKLERGLVNILISPAEIQKNAVSEAIAAKPDFLAPVYGTFYGITKGTGYFLGRLASGTLDVLTFPVNSPADWKQLIPVQSFSSE